MKENCGAQRHHYSMFGVGRSMLDVQKIAALLPKSHGVSGRSCSNQSKRLRFIVQGAGYIGRSRIPIIAIANIFIDRAEYIRVICVARF